METESSKLGGYPSDSDNSVDAEEAFLSRQYGEAEEAPSRRRSNKENELIEVSSSVGQSFVGPMFNLCTICRHCRPFHLSPLLLLHMLTLFLFVYLTAEFYFVSFCFGLNYRLPTTDYRPLCLGC